MMLRMAEHGDFPRVLIVEPFRKWPKNRWPKEVAWIIPAQEDPPKQTGSTGSPAHDESDGSNHDSSRSSPEGSRAASPTFSIGSAASSVVHELVVSSSSRSGSGSETPSLSKRSSDGEDDQASNIDQASHSGGEEGRSGNEGDPGLNPDRQADNTEGAGEQESEDSSSDSEDESSDDGMGASEGAQHLEEVYSWMLTALHKTAGIMCAGYVKASGEIQPIFNAVVREAVQPDKIYIRSTSGHLCEWGHALHNMFNTSGASAAEREEASWAARLAGLKCVRSLLADGQAFNAAEEQDIEKRLHDTIQAALKVANKRANKTLQKVNKRVPKIIRKYMPNDQAGTFLAAVHRSMGEHFLSVHGMVMSQVVIPFHVARGTYFTSGNMFCAINSVMPGISAAATSFQAAPQTLPALLAETAPSQTQPHEESLKTPSKDTSTGHSSKRGLGEAGTSSHGGDRGSIQKPSGGAPLMKQSRWDFKTKEQKIQTGGTPGSRSNCQFF